MSADNGIYILKTSEGEHRVIHAMAIDNINYDCPEGFELEPIETLRYFGSAKVHTTFGEAMLYATGLEQAMHEDNHPLEYGIKVIRTKHTWKELCAF